jgi:hypothetical protein
VDLEEFKDAPAEFTVRVQIVSPSPDQFAAALTSASRVRRRLQPQILRPIAWCYGESQRDLNFV